MLRATTMRSRVKNRSGLSALLIGASALGAGSPPAYAADRTVIRVTVVETKDRLPPDELRGIVRRHEMTVTLSGENRVSESNSSVRVGGGVGRKKRGPAALSGENSEAMGDESGHVVWHVLGERKLQRIRVGEQFLTMMNIEIDGDDHCHIEVKYLEQKGFTDVVIKRPDNGEMAHFSLPRLVSAACSIE
jgi:hypothetical protein